MKLSALLYLLPILYSYFAPDLREQLTNYEIAQATHRITQHPCTSPHPANHNTITATPTPITRTIPRALPRISRFQNLSELCESPKTEIPRVLALHRTRSADATQPPITKQEKETLPDLRASYSQSTASLPSPLNLGHAASGHFDFVKK